MTTLCEKNQLARFWQFLSQNGYAFGVFWAIMISLTSAVNDVFAKMLGERLHSLEVIFFRFLFSLISLIPFMMRQGGSEMFKTSFMKFHLIRGILGFAAMACWSLSLVYLPLAEVSTLFLTTPLFFLPLAFILLREHVTMQRWIATLLGRLLALASRIGPAVPSICAQDTNARRRNSRQASHASSGDRVFMPWRR